MNIDKLLGLADKFAILYADAREARMTDLPGSVWVDDAKRAKAELEAALVALIAEVRALRSALQEADTLMGHDDEFTEWRERWAHLWATQQAPQDQSQEQTP